MTTEHTPLPWIDEPIKTLQARLFVLENMAGYRMGEAWAAILATELRQAIRAVNAHAILDAKRDAAAVMFDALVSAEKSFAQFVRLGRIPENNAGYRDVKAALRAARGES